MHSTPHDSTKAFISLFKYTIVMIGGGDGGDHSVVVLVKVEK